MFCNPICAVTLYLSIHFSAHLLVTSQNSAKLAKRRITQTMPHNRIGTRLSDAKYLDEISVGSPLMGATNEGRVG